MPPAKVSAAKKAANGTVVDFDAERKKKARKKVTFRYMGQDWSLKEPNAAKFGILADSEDLASMAYLAESHVVAIQREDFRAAMLSDEDLGLESIGELVQAMQAAVYKDLALPT